MIGICFVEALRMKSTCPPDAFQPNPIKVPEVRKEYNYVDINIIKKRILMVEKKKKEKEKGDVFFQKENGVFGESMNE